MENTVYKMGRRINKITKNTTFTGSGPKIDNAAPPAPQPPLHWLMDIKQM